MDSPAPSRWSSFSWLPSYRRWAGMGFWAVTDQALFAGANFLVSVLLARWLEPAAYGAFSVAYAVFLLLGTLHTALWTEPMLVYGSGRYRNAFVAYQRILIREHWRFGALTVLGFGIVGGVFWVGGKSDAALSFLGLALAAPAVLYLWLVRRGAYVLMTPRLAAAGGALYLLLYLGLALGLFRLGLLNAATAFVIMALAAFVAAEVIRWRLHDGKYQTVASREIRALHWKYGRWALLAGGLSWVPGNLYYVILPLFHGLEATAELKAMMNLLMPILHFNGALGQLLVPGMVRANAQDGLFPFVKKALIVLTFPSIVYFFFIILFGETILHWIYADKYTQEGSLLFWFGLVPLVAALAIIFGSVLRSIEKPHLVTKGYFYAAIFCSTFGVAFVLFLGLSGAIFGLLISYAIAALTLFNESNKQVEMKI